MVSLKLRSSKERRHSCTMKIFLCSFTLLLTIPNAIFSSECPEYCSCPIPDSIFCYQRYSPDFPKDIPPAIRKLYLFNNGIEVIKYENFNNLNNLELLDLSQNKLKQLPDRVFEPLTSLKNLDLSSNQIPHISEDCFHGLAKLERLYLYSNHITTIHPAAFDGLENLLELKLQNNLMKTPVRFSMPQLLLLDLSYNLLQTLSPSHLETPNLESLKLASVGLNRVNDHLLGHLKNLHELDISGNHFTSVPSGVKEIPGLLSLNIAGNPMNPLKPEDLQNLKELNDLDISSLGLHGLPEEFPLLLPNLRKLRAAQNPFNCICSLAWFPKWLTDQGIALGKTEETRCHFPLSHARKILKTMKYSDFGCPSTTTVTTTTVKSTTTTTSVPVTTLPTTTKAGKIHKAIANPDDSTPPFVTGSPSTKSLDKSKEHFCPPQTCLNGGTCHLHEHGQVECTCPYGTSGMYCEIQNPSLPSPPEPESPRATVIADEHDITLCQPTRTSICLNLHRYIELRPYLNGIRITYSNLSGSDQRPRELSLPKSISEYTLRGLIPDSVYSICVSPFGEPTGTDRVCTKGRTNREHNPTQNFSTTDESSPSVTPPALVPATAILLVLVLIAIAIGVVCYIRWKKGKGHMDLHCEPSQLELDGVKAGLDNGALPQKQPQHMNPEPAVQNGGLEYVLLLQDHCASNNIKPSHKPPYF
uniref:Vasorin b n=2 Tax=Oryzias melastigma TaxID=30732 RepID=A0A3B3BUE1_ORYME